MASHEKVGAVWPHVVHVTHLPPSNTSPGEQAPEGNASTWITLVIMG